MELMSVFLTSQREPISQSATHTCAGGDVAAIKATWRLIDSMKAFAWKDNLQFFTVVLGDQIYVVIMKHFLTYSNQDYTVRVAISVYC